MKKREVSFHYQTIGTSQQTEFAFALISREGEIISSYSNYFPFSSLRSVSDQNKERESELHAKVTKIDKKARKEGEKKRELTNQQLPLDVALFSPSSSFFSLFPSFSPRRYWSTVGRRSKKSSNLSSK